jgi:hypothetical protein
MHWVCDHWRYKTGDLRPLENAQDSAVHPHLYTLHLLLLENHNAATLHIAATLTTGRIEISQEGGWAWMNNKV